ncbi:MAG: acyl-CoA thioesterase [Zhongshania sp.]|uniref:acyl-CoA thioesterase n=1 Tax=Zhongshania sp. TaxID=1971902 RepID=UPI002631DB36|nr:acyl-CoA thioesterase [Zhongshania sp.]MDF1693324.1 acyl-CoA thioesterase [Zhongshania sp.]
MSEAAIKALFDVLIKPRWADQDSMGHINNVQYFRYLEEARVDWLAQSGFGMGEGANNFGLIMAAVGLNFRREWHHGHLLRAKAWVLHIGNSSFSLRQCLYSEDGSELVADGESTLVCVDGAHRPVPLSESARAHLQAHLLAV